MHFVPKKYSMQQDVVHTEAKKLIFYILAIFLKNKQFTFSDTKLWLKLSKIKNCLIFMLIVSFFRHSLYISCYIVKLLFYLK